MRLFVALEVPEAVRREVARRMAGLRERPPRVAWIGMEAPADLEALQADATAAAVAAIGFAPEKRPFHPHVTLARCEPFWPRDAAEKFAAAFPGEIGPPWVADHGVLFES